LFTAVIAAVVTAAGLGVQPAAAQTPRRVALLIGNAAYEAEKPLRNPINDVNAIATVLRNDLGFSDVKVITNAKRRELVAAVERFGEAARGADAALFYFSGHGQQQGKSNYLLPVDARIETPAHVKSEGLDADDVQAALESASPRVSLLILDACRNNPFSTRTRSSAKGLTRPRNPEEGTLIAFATRDGDVADDGAGNNSPYAQALVNGLKQANRVPIQQMFDEISDSVKRQTENKQRPTKYGDLKVNIYLVNPVIPINNAAGSSSEAQAAARREEDARRIEDDAWADAARVDSVAGYEAYLAGYSNGRYAARAKIAIARLRESPISSAGRPQHGGDRPPESVPLAAAASSPVTGLGATGATIRTRGSIRIGHREASVPLSYLDTAGKPIGYSIDVCRRIVKALGERLGTEPRIEFVSITSADRITKMQNGAVDLECGSTANTRWRQAQVSFSNSVFLFSSRIAVANQSGIRDWSDLRGNRVAVTTGTTTANWLAEMLGPEGSAFRAVHSNDHAQSFGRLQKGEADAFVMDDVILAGVIATHTSAGAFRIVGKPQRPEPVGLMMRQDPEFKQFVDGVLATMARNDELVKLYQRWFVEPLPDGKALRLEMHEALARMLRAPNDRDYVQ